MPFEISKEFKFEAAHVLVGHDGKCARLHGHSWRGKVVLQGVALHWHGPKEGMLADYGDISKVLDPLVEQFLDHHYLNETLETDRPTSEFVAQWLYNRLRDKFGDVDSPCGILARLKAVEVFETCTSCARYGEAGL